MSSCFFLFVYGQIIADGRKFEYVPEYLLVIQSGSLGIPARIISAGTFFMTKWIRQKNAFNMDFSLFLMARFCSHLMLNKSFFFSFYSGLVERSHRARGNEFAEGRVAKRNEWAE